MSKTVEQKAERPRHIEPWATLQGKRVVVQEKGGVVLTGTFAGWEGGLLTLADAEVKGRGNIAKPERVWVDRYSVAHIHEAGEIQKVKVADGS